MTENEFPGAAAWIPKRLSLPVLAQSVQQCEGCDLYRHATQAVLGEGPSHTLVMMIGEQPGDVEDRTGRPFVGPAGKLLDRALADAHIDRRQLYVTNAVKHFKFEARGKRRIHGKPNTAQVTACRPWLEAEIKVVKPQLVVCLGATAAQSMLGRTFRLTKSRGQFFPHELAPEVTATVHPSALLRAPDEERRQAEYELFVRDLTLVRERMASLRASA